MNSVSFPLTLRSNKPEKASVSQKSHNFLCPPKSPKLGELVKLGTEQMCARKNSNGDEENVVSEGEQNKKTLWFPPPALSSIFFPRYKITWCCISQREAYLVPQVPLGTSLHWIWGPGILTRLHFSATLGHKTPGKAGGWLYGLCVQNTGSPSSTGTTVPCLLMWDKSSCRGTRRLEPVACLMFSQ